MKISVCMATYNGEKYIQEQIDSILKQLNYEDELIISDDKSTDNTISIINSIKDDRIKVTINETRQGYTKNFENSLKHATGDLIFLCDQDDIWLENKIEIMKKALNYSDFVVSDCISIDENKDIIYNSRIKEFGIRKGFINNFIRTRYIGCCMAFKRSVLEAILPFPKNDKHCPHDFWITLVSEYYFKTDLISQPLMIYRRHQNNSSTGGEGKGRKFREKIIGRAYCFYKTISIWNKVKKIKAVKNNANEY